LFIFIFVVEFSVIVLGQTIYTKINGIRALGNFGLQDIYQRSFCGQISVNSLFTAI